MQYKKYVLIIKHKIEEGPGIIEETLKEFKLDYNIVEFEKGERLPTDFENIKCVFSLGGPMNVYQTKDYPFLKEEEEFIKKIYLNRIPFLGICLGSQILAKTFGARVNLNKCKEIGFFEVELTEYGIEDKIFEGIEKNLLVFQYHEDCFEIPEKGLLIVKGKNSVNNQGFKIEDLLYGFQFHIEVDEKLLKNFGIKNIEKAKLRKVKEKGKRIIRNFLKKGG